MDNQAQFNDMSINRGLPLLSGYRYNNCYIWQQTIVLALSYYQVAYSFCMGDSFNLIYDPERKDSHSELIFVLPAGAFLGCIVTYILVCVLLTNR